MVNKVRIEIAGSRYVIATPEGEERVLSLGREIDAQVRQLMDGNDRVSLNDALVLCCLNYANAYKKKGTPVTEIFQYMFLLIFSNRNMYKRIVSMKRLS